MIDHISFSVTDFKKSCRFYDETLKILGISPIMTFETQEHQVAGYGVEGRPCFWMGVATEANLEELVGKARGFHVAFKASNVKQIHAWYDKCLVLGGKDNGKPGPRPEYHPGYYGAFIIDPDGWRIEAALHNYTLESKK